MAKVSQQSPLTSIKKQLELCLVKVPSYSKLTPQGLHEASPSYRHKIKSTNTHDLIDTLDEDPCPSASNGSRDLVEQPKSETSSVRVVQTDLLSFLNKSSASSEHEHTPVSQNTDLDSCGQASRALFPLSPNTSKQNKQRKRKLSEENVVIPRVTKRRKKENENQLQLDCGQKLLGHVTCKVCGMVYTRGQLDDQVEHSKFHTRFVTGVNFPGWKRERVVDTWESGRVIMVLPSDSKQHVKKMEDIRRLVDNELGFSVSPDQAKRLFTVFLCVSHRKKVMGCVFTERITQGYEVLGDKSSSFDSLSAWFCSTEPQPALLGINRLWVSGNCRRKGVASRLLDAARFNFTSGTVIPKHMLAFTDPTPDGKQFASSYCERSNFMVYR